MEEKLEEQLKKIPGFIGPHHPFSKEVERQREMQRVEELRPILDKLEEWRYSSLHAPIFLAYVA